MRIRARAPQYVIRECPAPGLTGRARSPVLMHSRPKLTQAFAFPSPGAHPSTSRSARVASGSLPSSSRRFAVPSWRFAPSALVLRGNFRPARVLPKGARQPRRTHEAAGVLPGSSRMNRRCPHGNLARRRTGNLVICVYPDDVPHAPRENGGAPGAAPPSDRARE